MKVPRLLNGVFIAVMFLGVSRCSSDAGVEHPYPIELQWVRNSVEYRAQCLQTYRAAWLQIRNHAAHLDTDWAAVFDIDETVLDNSGYQEIIHLRKLRFPEYWKEWVRRADSPLVPGAKTLIDSIRSLDPHAHIVFITNRMASEHEPTLENLKKVGLWEDGDVLLCRENREDTKSIRREEVRTGTGRCAGLGMKEIIALFGDQIGDIVDLPGNLSQDEKLVKFSTLDGWGARYFILPNPMYGYWVEEINE